MGKICFEKWINDEDWYWQAYDIELNTHLYSGDYLANILEKIIKVMATHSNSIHFTLI